MPRAPQGDFACHPLPLSQNLQTLHRPVLDDTYVRLAPRLKEHFDRLRGVANASLVRVGISHNILTHGRINGRFNVGYLEQFGENPPLGAKCMPRKIRLPGHNRSDLYVK